MRVIDFRSDTVTHPTPEMRRAIAEAEVGDDSRGDDPTAKRLEAMAAEMLGKEAAILVPSGTMANLTAILAHCQRGDEMILGDKAHIYLYEQGIASILGGVHPRTVHNDDRGMLDPDEVRAAIRPDHIYFPPTRLIALENTHNHCGGGVLTPDDTAAIAQVAREHDIPLHIDGSRIFNASVYLETPVAELARDADTVGFCLSKGLSGPIGSLVCGSHELVEKARFWRKRLGGTMRQVGIIAAAGIVALETMVDRLADDHANARLLAKGLSQIPGISIGPDGPQTNLVYFHVTVDSPVEVSQRLEERGIKGGKAERRWRFATHYGITADDIDYALDVVDATFRESAPA